MLNLGRPGGLQKDRADHTIFSVEVSPDLVALDIRTMIYYIFVVEYILIGLRFLVFVPSLHDTFSDFDLNISQQHSPFFKNRKNTIWKTRKLEFWKEARWKMIKICLVEVLSIYGVLFGDE